MASDGIHFLFYDTFNDTFESSVKALKNPGSWIPYYQLYSLANARNWSSLIGRLLKKGYDNLPPEERSLLALPSRLIEDYEDQTFPAASRPPHRTLQFLTEQNDLRQADLVSIFGSRFGSGQWQSCDQQGPGVSARRILQGLTGVVHLS